MVSVLDSESSGPGWGPVTVRDPLDLARLRGANRIKLSVRQRTSHLFAQTRNTA